MWGGQSGQGVGAGGHVVGRGWGARFLEGGVLLGPWWPWGERWGPWYSLDVTCQVGRIVVDGCPPGVADLLAILEERLSRLEWSSWFFYADFRQLCRDIV